MIHMQQCCTAASEKSSNLSYSAQVVFKTEILSKFSNKQLRTSVSLTKFSSFIIHQLHSYPKFNDSLY